MTILDSLRHAQRGMVEREREKMSDDENEPGREAVATANAEDVARSFHDTYERLAPSFGYETRKETRTFDPASSNGRLMIAVCAEISDVYRAQLLAANENLEITQRAWIESRAECMNYARERDAANEALRVLRANIDCTADGCTEGETCERCGCKEDGDECYFSGCVNCKCCVAHAIDAALGREGEK